MHPNGTKSRKHNIIFVLKDQSIFFKQQTMWIHDSSLDVRKKGVEFVPSFGFRLYPGLHPNKC